MSQQATLKNRFLLNVWETKKIATIMKEVIKANGQIN